MTRIKKMPIAANAFKYPLLIKRLLDYSTKLEPTRQIHYQDKFAMDYFELNRRVRKLANVLYSLGLDGGQTVAILDYDSHRYLEGFFTIPMTGNIIHTLNWRLSPEQILYTINHAEDVVIITHADFVPLLNSFGDKIKTVKQIIVATDGAAMPENSLLPVAGEYEELLAAAPDQFEFDDFDEDAVATTFYTTGTTGNPKGVFFTHRQIVLHTFALATNFGYIDRSGRLSNSDVYMPLTPFFHVHAWGFPFLATMTCMKQVYVGKFEPAIALQLFIKHQPTFSHCVPTILQMLIGHPATAEMDLSSWKVIIGGSALPKALAKAAVERKIDILTGYGMSETCPVLTISYISPTEKNIEDVDWQVAARVRTGLPIPLADVRVIDEYGKEVTHDDEAVGEVVARTPWLTQGYYGEPEQSENLWHGGWLHTGDVATMNGSNFLKISDRLKDVIKTGGEWASSIDLENIIGQHQAVQEVAVVGLPDAQWGERPHAMIVLKKGFAATAEDIKFSMQQFVANGHINKWAIPDKVIFVEVLPKTSVGKIDKKVIRAIVQEHLAENV
ncbi:fatty-acyl-CoA synthase [Flexibacter flexilis DSM 6793]|uniref:Fatty-acyl-CoA synthase n=1 Tax=Flexibacter flexilis DSM 6793 TaxID=927664 RepID=A0A1I1E629_9BACT|nr:long-chain-fatty-acid--CoA ligase [Flexibacter flexilis]SFB82601.1 fatty-acyl-CoA synthase [Flexibacter flexilis DSM 6793]